MIVLAVGGIVAAALFSVSDLKITLTTVISRDVARMSKNAELARGLSGVFADTNLLLMSFIENDERLKDRGDRLIGTVHGYLDMLRGETEDAELAASLEEFGQSLEALLQQCTTLNGQLAAIRATEANLDGQIAALKDLPWSPQKCENWRNAVRPQPRRSINWSTLLSRLSIRPVLF